MARTSSRDRRRLRRQGRVLGLGDKPKGHVAPRLPRPRIRRARGSTSPGVLRTREAFLRERAAAKVTCSASSPAPALEGDGRADAGGDSPGDKVFIWNCVG